ncbi:enoyl-[acyl-carrier protein] reductase I [Chitinophaga sp. CF118]|uniref:SDR family oxidoreductase n=1 Tax=Chitinophaga sp. CF118 TaxID=1884367 RepID=UPI0008E576FF|nr:SDR family oxidoreductase [Chitinophaga sp. CF118]SFD76015.1 enoyl-[acyl-carrier protein] reductase I [Chitinophaga sp. CF118]
MVKEFEVHQYWAVVLGGSSGLGLAAARKLAAHGMNICIVHRDPRIDMEKINAAFDSVRATGVRLISFNADAINAEKRGEILVQLKEQMGDAGRVRCLLHSIARGNLKAMISESGPILSIDDFRLTMEGMAFSLYDWTQGIVNSQLFAADARIISFTSEGSNRAWKHYAAVSAAKAALEAITRNIALEYAPKGLRANCIQAGITDTRSLQMIPGSEQLINHDKNRNPFHRLTTPEDVANVVYLLCKDEAAWISGTIIPVDGGSHIS